MIKLSHLLAKEQDELRYQLKTAEKKKKQREFGLSYVNTSKSSSLLSKASVFKQTMEDPIRVKVETVHLPPTRPPLRRVHKNINFSKQSVVMKEDQKKKLLTQAHFLCSMMQETQTETGKQVHNFLNGQLEKTSYESIVQMELSANALQNAAKEMSKTLYFEGEDMELQNLKDKFIDQIRLSKFRPKGRQTIIFKRNYGQKYEMMIDQVAHKQKKTEESNDFDIFIPKSQMDQFIKYVVYLYNSMMQEKIDNKMKEQKEELLRDEQKLLSGLVNNVRQFREDLREVNYTMNHLRVKKKSKPVLKTSSSIQLYTDGRQTTQQKKMDEESKADLRLRVMKALRNFIDKLKRFNISLQDVVNNQVFPSGPYERINSQEFFQQVKLDNTYEVDSMLRDCRFHVYDIDNQLKTALHHAAANNLMEMCKILIESGSDFDARDMMGRTPLHLAAKNNHLDVVRALLVYGSSPSVKTIAGKRAQDMTNVPVIKALINNSRKLHFMMDLQPYKLRKKFWIERAIHFFQDDDPEKILKLQLYKAQAKLFLK